MQGAECFLKNQNEKTESSSTLSVKIALVIISGRVTVLLLFGDRVGGKSACRPPCISSLCPWWKSVPFGNPLRGTSGGWIQAVKTRARELQSCSTKGLAWTNRPQRSREQYRISAATRPLHQSGFASGRSLVQPGSEGSVLQSRACSVGSNWLKSPEYYLVIRQGVRGKVPSLEYWDCKRFWSNGHKSRQPHTILCSSLHTTSPVCRDAQSPSNGAWGCLAVG